MLPSEALSGSVALRQGLVSMSMAHIITGYSTQDSTSQTLPGQHSRADTGGVSVSEQPR